MPGGIHALTPPSNKQTKKSLTSALTYENEYFYDSPNAMIIPTLKVKKKRRRKKWTGFPGGSAVKNPPARAGDAGSMPGLGRSSGEGNGSPSPVFWGGGG